MNGCLRLARVVLFARLERPFKNIQKCEICRSLESQQKETLLQHPVPDRSWAKEAVDLLTYGAGNNMVAVDYMSNFWEVDRLESLNSQAVTRKLKPHFVRHGITATVISDIGPQFKSAECLNHRQKMSFNHVTCSPGYAQPNGMAENAVKTTETLIQKAKLSRNDPWLEFRNTAT